MRTTKGNPFSNAQKLNGFLRLVIAVIFIFIPLTALEGVKDISYFLEHIDEARALRNGRCNTTANDKFTKDFECAAVNSALEKDTKIKQRDELIAALQKVKAKLSAKIKIDGDEQRKYDLLHERFSSNFDLTEDFIGGCISNSERTTQNGLECLAAIDTMLENLSKTREKEIAESEKEIKYKEYYRQYFREHPNEVNDLLDGRCKELMANPWYNYQHELQDKECNAALNEQQRQKRLNKSSETELPPEEKKYEKSLSYFKKNISEAKKFDAECKAGTNKDEITCQNAAKAFNEYTENEQKKADYTKSLQENLDIAKKTYESCSAGTDKDTVKCDIATSIVNNEKLKQKQQNELNRYLSYYKDKIGEAEKLLNNRCKAPENLSEEFAKDIECAAARKAISKDIEFKARERLIEKISAKKQDILTKYPFKKAEDKKKYNDFKKQLEHEPKLADDFIIPCIENSLIASERSIECIASFDNRIKHLEEEKERELAEQNQETSYKEYYRKYFRTNKDEARKLLNGRCKIILSDSWYNYDPDIKDRECEAAKNEIEAIEKEEEMEKLREAKAAEKSLDYYKKNVDESAKLSEKCQNGIIDNLDYCQYAIQVIEDIAADAKKRVEYQNYYKNHILSAQFHHKFCKATMINLDIECQVVNEILQNHKDREKDPDLVQKYTIFYSKNPFEAKITALSNKCADLLSDQWYFLDKNLQTEECDAASEFSE